VDNVINTIAQRKVIRKETKERLSKQWEGAFLGNEPSGGTKARRSLGQRKIKRMILACLYGNSWGHPPKNREEKKGKENNGSGKRTKL